MSAKKYSPLDAIRTFHKTEVLAKKVTSFKANKKALEKKLKKVAKIVDAMTPVELLKESLDNWHPRYDNYLNSTWELKKISLADCGVWPKMGGFPLEVTVGSVVDTASYIEPYLEDKTKLTLEMAKALYIERLKDSAELITEYIPLVVLEDNVIRQIKIIPEKERRKFKKCKYDIDDGNYRAIALALLGKKEVIALVGKRIYKSDLLY